MITLNLQIHVCSHCTRVFNAAPECVDHEAREHNVSVDEQQHRTSTNERPADPPCHDQDDDDTSFESMSDDDFLAYQTRSHRKRAATDNVTTTGDCTPVTRESTRDDTKTAAARPTKRTRDGGDEYKCTYCGKQTGSMGHKKQHERMHTGVKPFPCQHCARKFSQVGHRNAHQAVCEKKRDEM